MKIFAAVIITVLLVSANTHSQPLPSSSLLTELRSATISGVIDISGAVVLNNGKWSGKPYVKGGAERPSVHLVEEMVLSGDVNGDGAKDVVAFLASSTGGSATQINFALFLRTGSVLTNKATVWLGDRVQIRSAAIDSAGVIGLTLVRIGEGDAMCCPGEVVMRRWSWKNGSLEELPELPLGRFSTASLEGTVWKLESWKQGELVDTNTAVTLTFDHDKVNGRSACNQYFAKCENGSSPGEILISAGGSTKMMCPPEMMKTEDRYLRLLSQVKKFSFSFGRVKLDYVENNSPRSLIFVPNSVNY
ncbi:MAG: META domain-containing protein [Bacteroidota bacterium]